LEDIATMRTQQEMGRVDMQHTQDMKMKRNELGFQKDKEMTRLDVEAREDEQDAVQMKRLIEMKKDMKAHSVDQDIKRHSGIEMESKRLDSMTAIELAKLEAEKAKALALAEAEKAKYQMDTFTRAEDRERAHQYQMTGLSSNMMQASKQGTPTTLVQGAGYTSTAVGQDHGHEDTMMCPNCGEKVKKGKFCLSCGSKL
jgi:3',5'-cyclic AMP phosphodiesterase CpdA